MKNFPKKHLGQHFLTDTGVARKILECIQPSECDVVIEIGAGHGELSSLLAPMIWRLLAIEIDADCIPLLKSALQNAPHADIVMADILETDVKALLNPYLSAEKRLRACGNLPYNIATAIIEKLVTMKLPLADMTFMVQLEMAQRITASPGSRRYGFFSVLCQHYCETMLCFKVSPGSFRPRPKVYSAVVKLSPHRQDSASELDRTLVLLAKAAFAHRRKKITNALRLHPKIGPVGDSLLDLAKIDGSKRAEQLSVEDYELLAHIFYKYFIGNDLQISN
jgi:16S rRNA (adenine1518-N6/adenine1519-N6)-dimethyltransferase